MVVDRSTFLGSSFGLKPVVVELAPGQTLEPAFAAALGTDAHWPHEPS
jgi:hypothetical protein